MKIYKLVNQINNKLYIGKTEKSLSHRFKMHVERARQNINTYLYDAMNYYGYSNFKIYEIDRCSSVDELNLKEIFWIEHYNATNRDIGYNMTCGGSGGNTFTSQDQERKKEILEKRRQSMLGKNKRPRTEEEKQNLRLKNLGKKYSELTKQKHRISSKYSQNRPEVIEKKRLAMLGRKLSKETRLRMSQVKMGIKRTEASKFKQRETLRKKKELQNV